MDDMEVPRPFTIEVGGVKYKAAPLGESQMIALQMIKSVSEATMLSILSGVLGYSLGKSTRDGVAVRMATGELTLKDLIKALTRLAKLSTKVDPGLPVDGTPADQDRESD